MEDCKSSICLKQKAYIITIGKLVWGQALLQSRGDNYKAWKRLRCNFILRVLRCLRGSFPRPVSSHTIEKRLNLICKETFTGNYSVSRERQKEPRPYCFLFQWNCCFYIKPFFQLDGFVWRLSAAAAAAAVVGLKDWCNSFPGRAAEMKLSGPSFFHRWC